MASPRWGGCILYEAERSEDQKCQARNFSLTEPGNLARPLRPIVTWVYPLARSHATRMHPSTRDRDMMGGVALARSGSQDP